MSEAELIELSQRVAKKLGIDPQRVVYRDTDDGWSDLQWLHEDSARCFELMCKHDLHVEPGGSTRDFSVARTGHLNWKEFRFTHNSNNALATRIAILKALDASHD